MKKILIVIIIFSSVAVFGPMAVKSTETVKESPNNKAISVAGKKADYSENNSFKVKLNSGKVIDVLTEEYLIGCIAGEMPITYDDEALKAQAVASYTFALYKKSIGGKDYDVTADYKTDQCYLTEQEQKEKWGENYQVNRKRLEKVIKSVKGEWIAFEGEPILSVYHAISCGKTYSCGDVWGKDLPYLKSVDSSFDKLSDDYKSETQITVEEFCEKLGLKTDNAGEAKIELSKDKNSRADNVTVNGVTLSGKEFVDLFALKSQNLEITVKANTVSITTYGRGHGVGMSQVGADKLAKSGSTYKEILHHYYSGCSIEK
ncbi:MAG TPA: stage II sporulation protein D [Ruminococcaceae bacterium]|nr:stage II sporulation protein D [Oscillospiraceae bacterium]